MTGALKGGCMLGAICLLLLGCASPGANMLGAIDIRVYDSDEQQLIIRNATNEPMEIFPGRGSTKTLAPNETMQIRFRVVSLESHLRVADRPYYFRTAGPVNNRFEELDGLQIVDPALATIHLRDRFGTGEFTIDLESCGEVATGNRWESKQWGPATHRLDLPIRMDGAAQPVCPRP